VAGAGVAPLKKAANVKAVRAKFSVLCALESFDIITDIIFLATVASVVAYGDGLSRSSDSLFHQPSTLEALSFVYEYRSPSAEFNLDTQAHYDLDWRSLAQLIQQGADSPGRREFTLTLYRRDTCGTAREIGVLDSQSYNTLQSNFYNTYPGQSFPFTQATALRPLTRVLSSFASGYGQYSTRNLRCVDGKLSELIDLSQSPPVKVAQSAVARNYGAAEQPCCALDAPSSPMYLDGTLNPGGTSASSYGDSSSTTAQFSTEVFWREYNVTVRRIPDPNFSFSGSPAAVRTYPPSSTTQITTTLRPGSRRPPRR